MVLQSRVADEALAADVAGKGVSVPAVHAQVLIQLVLVTEGLSTVCTLKWTEALPDEKVLEGCILLHKRQQRVVERKKRRLDTYLRKHKKSCAVVRCI